MLRTGREHLETLRDGRVVYIGSEKVTDVCNHPAFRNAARTVAGIYDLKRLEEHPEVWQQSFDALALALFIDTWPCR